VVHYFQHYIHQSTFIVDVTAAWKTKMRAIAAFKSQFHDPKSKEPGTLLSKLEFLDMIEVRGRHFGSMIGARYGEAFATSQPPRIDDVIAAYRGREE
jgi:N-acetylglucosamine malate deacetylase 1